MQPRYWAGLAALALLATVGNATAETREWSGVTSGYTIDQNLRHILITAPGAYKFESVTNGALDDIVKIDTDLTQGQYNEPIEAVVYIARDPNLGTGPGCRDLGQVTIGNGLPVSFGDWLLSRDIAALASVHVRNIYGTCDVSGGARAALRVYGNVLGPVTVDGDVDRLYLADFVAAPIYCGGDVGSLSVAGYLGSSIYVAGAVGAFDVDGYLSSTGALEVDGDVGIIGVNETPGYWGSSIRVGESVELVALLGTMGSTATLDIGGDPGDVEVADFNAIGGTVNVAQDVSGNIVFEYLSRFYGAIHIGGDVLGDWILPRRELTGDITIDGTLSSRIHAQRDLDQPGLFTIPMLIG